MLRQLRTAPNMLTLLRLIIIPLIVVMIIEHRYRWALSLFLVAGISDALDGLLARLLHQKTVLGQYLDPIADKLLLSTMFLVLALCHLIAWRFTVLVFCRDVGISVISALLYAIAGLRDYSPSIFGKLNTVAQVLAVVFVLLDEVTDAHWITVTKYGFLWATAFLTIASAAHYAALVDKRLSSGSAA